jgi:hypothetical protein
MDGIYLPLKPGTTVRTTQANQSKLGEWTAEALIARKWGEEGEILVHHDSHGLCYDVRHADGSIGCYDPSELEIVDDPADQLAGGGLVIDARAVASNREVLSTLMDFQ